MKIIVATQNAHKAKEIAAILENKFEVLTLKEIGFLDKIVEDGKIFEENARIKVSRLLEYLQTSFLWRATLRRGLPLFMGDSPFNVIALADDSGLEVEFLEGAPGVFSARYAGEPSNDQANTQKLLKVLEGVPAAKRTARFRCVIAAAKLKFGTNQEPSIKIFEGICDGKIGFKPKGSNGFGYDPVFFPDGFCRTFAELDEREKNEISHRSKAMREFISRFI